MAKNNQNMIMLGSLVVVGFILGAVYVTFNDFGGSLQTNQLVDERTPTGVIGNTEIFCPRDHTVISTLGGTPDAIPKPLCKAPNPSIEVLECGDEFIDFKGNPNIVECRTITT